MARNPFLSEQTDYLDEVEKFAGFLSQDFGPFFGRDVIRLVAELRAAREALDEALTQYGYLAAATVNAEDKNVAFKRLGQILSDSAPEGATDGT